MECSDAGRLGGQSKSDKKASAARLNGAKGGRPRGRKAEPVTVTINRPAKMAPEKLREIVAVHIPKATEAAAPVRLPIFDELSQIEEGGE